MLSEPTSPILGIAPKWLIQTPKGISGARYALKMLAWGLLCVLLGISTSSLYRVSELEQTELHRDGYHQEILGISYGKYSGVEKDIPGYLNRGPPPANALHKDAETKLHPGDSIVSKLADKLSSWKPWAKAPGRGSTQEQDEVSDIYAHSSTPHTKEVIITPWNATSNPPSSPPVLAKITIVTGGSNSIYERALRTHTEHNRRHGYPMHTLRQSILNDVWSKPAYILSVILRELAKPEHERLQWLFWVDADTIVINPHVPAETFLPPRGWADDVHLLVAHDFNGLNNGVFPIRVHQWSVDLLVAVLSYPFYHADEFLLFRDQSAMSRLLESPRFARHTVLAPQRWFNAYQGEINETIAPFQTRPGDLLVHFAGVPDREERMRYWLERAEEHLPEWEIEFKHTSYTTETRQFWDEEKKRRGEIKRQAKKLREEMDGHREALKQGMKRWGDALSEEERKNIDETLVAAYRAFEDDDTALNVEALRKAIDKFKEASKPLQDRVKSSNKLLLKEAHTVLFAAEKLTVSLPPAPGTKEDLHKLEEAIKSFKAVLLAPAFQPENVEAEMRTVQQRQQDVEKKVEALKEEDERKRLREMAVSGDERKAELENANAARLRTETTAGDGDNADNEEEENKDTTKEQAEVDQDKTKDLGANEKEQVRAVSDLGGKAGNETQKADSDMNKKTGGEEMAKKTRKESSKK